MELTFSAVAQNEALARTVISAFLVQADPPLSVINEVRTAVSEAVTNAVVHAYIKGNGKIVMRAQLSSNQFIIEIEDFGRGIEDIDQAMQPFYTTAPQEERTGMGFALMQAFMDEVNVLSSPGCGTLVTMKKQLRDDDAP